MTSSIRDFRAASYLPPVSVCLVLAAASLILLCSRTETSGDLAGTTVAGAKTEVVSARDGSAQSSEAPVSPEELRLWTLLHEAELHLDAGHPGLALVVVRRAQDLAESTRAANEIRVAIQRQLAESLDATGNHEESVEVWWRLLSMSPQHEEVARGLAASLRASGRDEEARRVYREILHTDLEPEDEPQATPVDQPSRAANASGSSSAR